MNKNYCVPLQFMKVFGPKCLHFWYYLQFLLFIMTFLSKNLKKISLYQKYVYSGENTSILCSQITVVNVYVNGFIKKSPACHSDSNGI